MLGVDKSDQLIAYYRPEIRVRRFWMSMMFHCIDIMRINMYIINKALTPNGNRPFSHKGFVTYLIEALIGRSNAIMFGRTRNEVNNVFSPPPKMKRNRMVASYPQLSDDRFKGKAEDHVETMAPNNFQRECVYCRYRRALDKLNKVRPLHKVKEPSRMCGYCNVHLCKQHFVEYHKR